MPTNRTRRKRTQSSELSESKVEHLLTGRAVMPGFEYPETERKKDWQKYKDPLMTYWFTEPKDVDEIIGFAKPGGLFTRPAAWWDYEAPERRKCLNMDISKHPVFDDSKQWAFDKWAKGIPKVGWRKDGQSPQFETQKEYLIRLDLLTETEKQLLENE